MWTKHITHSCCHMFIYMTSLCCTWFSNLLEKFKVPQFKCAHLSFHGLPKSILVAFRNKPLLYLKNSVFRGKNNSSFSAVLTGIQWSNQSFFVNTKNSFTNEFVLTLCKKEKTKTFMDDSTPDYTVVLNRANSPTASFSLGQC